MSKQKKTKQNIVPFRDFWEFCETFKIGLFLWTVHGVITLVAQFINLETHAFIVLEEYHVKTHSSHSSMLNCGHEKGMSFL